MNSLEKDIKNWQSSHREPLFGLICRVDMYLGNGFIKPANTQGDERAG